MRVRAQALPRAVGAVHPVAVALAGPDAGQEPVPDAERVLAELDALLGQIVVDQAHLDDLRAGRGDGEARAVLVGVGTEREDRHDRPG